MEEAYLLTNISRKVIWLTPQYMASRSVFHVASALFAILLPIANDRGPFRHKSVSLQYNRKIKGALV